jgi:hypothetical protein
MTYPSSPLVFSLHETGDKFRLGLAEGICGQKKPGADVGQPAQPCGPSLLFVSRYVPPKQKGEIKEVAI